MMGVKGIFREEVTFEVHFKISYRSPNEKEMEDTTRIRSSGQNSKNSRDYPVMGCGIYEPLWRVGLGMRILMDF